MAVAKVVASYRGRGYFKIMQDLTRTPDTVLTRIVDPHGYVVAADIGGSNLRLGLADMTGNILARWSSSTVGIKKAASIVDLMGKGVDVMLEHAAATREDLVSIAAGAPGITDFDGGVVIATSYLMGWRDTPLRAMLSKAFNVPAAVDNDVNLAALGEKWAGAAGDVDSFVFLAIGTGIGAGIMLNGEILRGSKWSAGEIGYMLIPGTSDNPSAPGEPGPLEALIGGEGIEAQWRRDWDPGHTRLPRELKATEVFDQALSGDAIAYALLNRTAHMLARTIYNISLVLNCELFIMGGSVGLHSALCHATSKVFTEWNSRVRPVLRASGLAADAQLIGAVSLALDTALNVRQSQSFNKKNLL